MGQAVPGSPKCSFFPVSRGVGLPPTRVAGTAMPQQNSKTFFPAHGDMVWCEGED